MKRTEIIDMIVAEIETYLDNPFTTLPEKILARLEEAGMTPKPYIHPRAVQEGLTDPKWGYIKFIDKYPEHHFRRGRPYEYYIDGWEPENE